MTPKWDVWHVFYATCEEVVRDGDRPPEQLAINLSFERAQAKVNELGFGYCVKQSEPN